MANKNLSNAKNAKNDEFYTQLNDIQAEVNAYIDYDQNVFRGKTVLLPCDDPEWSNFTRFFAQNFERFGLRKLISTSYAAASKKIVSTGLTRFPGFDADRKPHARNLVNRVNPVKKPLWYQPSLFEQKSPQYDEKKTAVRGKIFILDHDANKNGKIDFEDLEWKYLEGDGDFRSDEVRKLRDEADIIITNPPFSLFREFLAWILGDGASTRRRRGGKKFLIIGNMNAITYKEVFPLIKANKMWMGNGFSHGNAYFRVAEGCRTEYASGVYDQETKLVKFRNVAWFTNLEHGRRHQPLRLMTMADNIKFSKHKEVRGRSYRKYDNYDAIEVPFTDAIPSDYDGVMGVPISFLDKYCPEQFEIMGMCENEDLYGLKTRIYSREECQRAYYSKFEKKGTYDLNASGVLTIAGIQEKVYQRILIRHRS